MPQHIDSGTLGGTIPNMLYTVCLSPLHQSSCHRVHPLPYIQILSSLSVFLFYQPSSSTAFLLRYYRSIIFIGVFATQKSRHFIFFYSLNCNYRSQKPTLTQLASPRSIIAKYGILDEISLVWDHPDQCWFGADLDGLVRI